MHFIFYISSCKEPIYKMGTDLFYHQNIPI